MGKEIDRITDKLHSILNVEKYISIYKDFLDQKKWEAGLWSKIESITTKGPLCILPIFLQSVQRQKMLTDFTLASWALKKLKSLGSQIKVRF